VAVGISPVLGGLISDQVGPRAPWLGGALIGFLAVLAFWRLNQHQLGNDVVIS
jgi:predicted MFS family arabinose efflux permease